MKRIFLPLLAITASLAVAGIEVFQTGQEQSGNNMIAAEIAYVLMLVLLFALGLLYMIKRSKDKKMGFPEEDELSKSIIMKSASLSFFLSLPIWLLMLILNVHTGIESKFLFSYGLLGISFVFLVSWAVSIIKLYRKD